MDLCAVVLPWVVYSLIRMENLLDKLSQMPLFATMPQLMELLRQLPGLTNSLVVDIKSKVLSIIQLNHSDASRMPQHHQHHLERFQPQRMMILTLEDSVLRLMTAKLELMMMILRKCTAVVLPLTVS